MLVKLGDYCRDLLSFNADNITIGRTNFNKLSTTEDFIVVDYLTVKPISRADKFDGDDEKMHHIVLNKWNATITFLGENALTNANSFDALANSQTGYELQRDLGIRVNHITGMTNLKELNGTLRTEAYECQLIINEYVDTIIDTLRIDEAQIEILTD